MTHDSQRLEIQRWLAAGNTITIMESANRFGCFALSQRISEIKKHFKVDSVKVKRGRKWVAEYSMPRARERARARCAA